MDVIFQRLFGYSDGIEDFEITCVSDCANTIKGIVNVTLSDPLTGHRGHRKSQNKNLVT